MTPTAYDRIATERLVLRRWTPADRAPFAALNADPEVMRHFPTVLDRAASDAMVDRIEAGWDDLGCGLWALEEGSTGAFLGFTGLIRQTFPASFTPCVEVGWRLARSAWGVGYATEAARVALSVGFDDLRLEEIVSITIPANEPSQAVMRRLGMSRDPADDFEHPNLPDGHPMRPHVLHRLGRDRYRELTGAG